LVVVTVLAGALPAHGGSRGGATQALVVCASQKNEQAAKVRVDRCRANETPVPLDAQTLQGFTPQQLMSGRVVPPGSGVDGFSLVDAIGQLVGYVIMTPSGSRVVRPAGTGLVALSIQHAFGGGPEVYPVTELGLRYFYRSADCSDEALLLNDQGFDGVIREGHVLVGQPGSVVYPGDFPGSSRSIGLVGVQSYSLPVDDETGHCNHDQGDPVSVPIGGGRCCVSLSPYTDLKSVGPVVTEELPTFVQPFHFAGF
jgi:hypothetical protein